MTVWSLSRTAGAKPRARGRLPVAAHEPGVEAAAAVITVGPIAARLIKTAAAATRRAILAGFICVAPILGPSTGRVTGLLSGARRRAPSV
jgi:hypothetical protein